MSGGKVLTKLSSAVLHAGVMCGGEYVLFGQMLVIPRKHYRLLFQVGAFNNLMLFLNQNTVTT